MSQIAAYAKTHWETLPKSDFNEQKVVIVSFRDY